MTPFGLRAPWFVALAPAVLTLSCAGADLTLPEDATPTHIDIVTGNGQAGIAGGALTLPLVVRVTDQLGRPVSGLTVEYTVLAGQGEVAPASPVTDAEGRASGAWTLGPAAGAQEVSARAVGGGAPADLAVTFDATAVAGSGSLLIAVGGDDQRGSVNSLLPDSLVVLAGDAIGNPVSGVTVHWTVQGGGAISPETVVTGPDGRAAAARTLGAIAGQQNSQATADGLAGSPVTFVHTALASSPTTLTAVSGDNQTAPAGFEVAEDLVVQLADVDGNGVGGRSITWVVATGGGTVSPATSSTDANGFVRARWTLGASIGTNTVNAVFSGLSPVRFTAYASADVPARLTLVSGDNQSAVVGQALPNPLVVKVTDANDNPVENVSVAWAAAGGGSVSAATVATDAGGLARVSRTLGSAPGTYQTTAQVVGIAGSSLTFTSTATVGVAARLSISAQPGATAQNGVALSPQPVVQVQDAFGNNLSAAGRNVTAELFDAPAGGALGGGVTKPTGVGGSVAFTDLRITGPAGRYTLRFRSGTLTPAISSQVTLSAGAVSAGQSTLSANPGAVVVGAASTITVTARDAGGNPVPGATVLLAATGSGNTIGQPSGTTNSSGQVTGTFASTSVGSHVVTATINGTPITASATIVVNAGAVDAGRTTVSATPSTVATAATSTVTVIALDAAGNPVPGASVVLAATGTGNTIGQPASGTNAGGVATGTFSSTGLGEHSITATVNGTPITDNAVVTVVPGTVSASRSTVSATPAEIRVGGVPATVTVTARDAAGVPVPGATVALSVTGSGNTVSSPAPTDASGATTATFTSTQTGSHDITATINGVRIADNSTVNVIAGPVSAGQSTIAASPGTVPSGVQSTVTVVARDASGNPIEGAVVVLAATGSAVSIGQPSGGTATNGAATGTFASTSVGTHTLSATISGTLISATATVTVTAGAVSAGRSTVSSLPTTVTAGSPSTVTVTARDADGNPVSGATVTLSATGGGNEFSTSAPTNAGGVTTAAYTSTQAGQHVITGVINGTGITDDATVVVRAAVAASLTFTTQPTDTPAGTTIDPPVVVTVQDQFGNPATGTVAMSLIDPSSSATLSGTLSVAAVDGAATFADLSVDQTSLFAYKLSAGLGDLATESSGFLVTPSFP